MYQKDLKFFTTIHFLYQNHNKKSYANNHEVEIIFFKTNTINKFLIIWQFSRELEKFFCLIFKTFSKISYFRVVKFKVGVKIMIYVAELKQFIVM